MIITSIRANMKLKKGITRTEAPALAYDERVAGTRIVIRCLTGPLKNNTSTVHHVSKTKADNT